MALEAPGLGAADAPAFTFQLPPAPNATAMTSAFKECDLKAGLALLHQCISDLEAFRNFNLEQYNSDVQEYARHLKQLDRRLEAAHAKGRIADDDYQDDHENLVDELSAATLKSGRYLVPYYTYLIKYEADVRLVKTQIINCTTNLNCN